ncbi:hypothetical protein AWC00_20520 [Mycobacterium conspicuum]|nr:hypothetical protein AWC00_20520 [Mycobacterium conspicuum]
MAAFRWSFVKCVHQKVLAAGARSTCVADYLSYVCGDAHFRRDFGATCQRWRELGDATEVAAAATQIF